jgi:PPOX class probable F420-dependent enzyme
MAQLDEKVREFLEARRFAVLATINEDGMPQQSTMWYYVDGDEIVMNTRRKRIKERNLARDPRLSFCVEDGYDYVTLTGSATLIYDQAIAQADILRMAIMNHGVESGEKQARDLFSKQDRVTIRMRVDKVSAHLD